MLHCWLGQKTKHNNIFTQSIAIYMYMHIALSVQVFQLKKKCTGIYRTLAD